MFHSRKLSLDGQRRPERFWMAANLRRNIMTKRPFFTLLIVTVASLSQLAGSCATDTDVHYSEDRHVYHDAPPPDVVVREERVYREPDRVYVEPPRERVYVEQPPERVYVEPEHRGPVYHEEYHHDDVPPRIPRGSYLAEDKEGKIRWIANDSGTFYVYDVSKEFVRYSGPVRRGQEIIVQPGDDIVYVDGKIVQHNNLRRDARHQLWLNPGTYNATRTNEERGHGEKTGGAADPGRTMPKDVYRVASGRGDLAINAAKQHGKVFVYDEVSRSVIYTADIDRGNSFKIDVSKGIVYVNSKKVANVNFPRGHDLSLYIDYK